MSINNMQFGAIFNMRQVQERHQARKKKLYYAFVDLEKAFDRVPKEVARWALWKLAVDCCCFPSETYGRNGVTPIFRIIYKNTLKCSNDSSLLWWNWQLSEKIWKLESPHSFHRSRKAYNNN